MKQLLLSFLVFSSLLVKADMKLARIKDADGYTNVRSGKGTEFAIVGTIKKDEFFYCSVSDSNWSRVCLFQWDKGQPLAGYIYKSRIEIIETLADSIQKNLFQQVFKRQEYLCEQFLKAGSQNKYDQIKHQWRSSKDSMKYVVAVKNLSNYNDSCFDPLLEIFPAFYCRTVDTSTLHILYETLWADRGSTDETLSLVAECFICQPELSLHILTDFNDEQKKIVIDLIDFGLSAHYWIDYKDQYSKDMQYIRLRKILDAYQ